MTAPIRLRLSRAKGFDLQLMSREANGLPAKKVTRPGRWGNPWEISRRVTEWVVRHPGHQPVICTSEIGARASAAHLFRRRMAMDAAQQAVARATLRGHNLGCWCPLPEPGQPDHCHAAVLLEVANG